jgi:hypothetical protein
MGPKTGPDPTNRGTSGTKRHLVVDRNGLLLSIMISAANRHDNQLLEATLDAVWPIKQPGGRPRKRPDKLHHDQAYDRQALRSLNITPGWPAASSRASAWGAIAGSLNAH